MLELQEQKRFLMKAAFERKKVRLGWAALHALAQDVERLMSCSMWIGVVGRGGAGQAG